MESDRKAVGVNVGVKGQSTPPKTIRGIRCLSQLRDSTPPSSPYSAASLDQTGYVLRSSSKKNTSTAATPPPLKSLFRPKVMADDDSPARGGAGKRRRLLFDGDEEREKTWETDRPLLEQRGSAFISAMDALLGGTRNPRYSPWKGSVVDSLVGVFLTQNASDKQSSSAFMSLAAAYPNKKVTDPCEEPCSTRAIYFRKEKMMQGMNVNESENKSITSSRRRTTTNQKPNQILARDQQNVKESKMLCGSSVASQLEERKEQIRKKSSEDAVDWDTVRCANVKEIAQVIFGRGMNNRIAERIKKFLQGVHQEHGSLNLEWLRDCPPDAATNFFRNIEGIGLKSIECVKLLTLNQAAFPVDTNVGRIAVRLGWVELQPLPVWISFHELELYPKVDSIQEYLWRRLFPLPWRTLYTLHKHLIDFGKVICTKIDPNCHACPMRAECKHFASASASAILSPPKPSPRSMVDDANLPIADMEDFGIDHPVIPQIFINEESFLINLVNFANENDIPLRNDSVSRGLGFLRGNDAYASLHKKRMGSSRTEHLVYELPDSHKFVPRIYERQRDDKNSFLLAVWSSVGETSEHSKDSSHQSEEHDAYVCGEHFWFLRMINQVIPQLRFVGARYRIFIEELYIVERRLLIYVEVISALGDFFNPGMYQNLYITDSTAEGQ